MKKAKDVLEIDKVIELINHYILTLKGKNILYSYKTFNDKKSLVREYTKVDEIRRIYSLKGNFPIFSKLDMSEEIKSLKAGKFLSEDKIMLLRDEIKSTYDLNIFYKKLNERFLYVEELFTKIKPNLELYDKINKTFSNNGEILDSASPTLGKIRKDIRNIDKRIHEQIGSLLSLNKDKITGDNYQIKNGHFVLPVNTSLKRSIPGVVQDISDSGQTTYIEPFEIAELENDKSILELKERDEINKILDEFKTFIIFDASQLILNNNSIGEIDYLLSKVKYAKEYECVIPKISDKQIINLKSAKHPLLDKNICVPNTFILGENKTLMLISGPNAGGKTVALKTIGTLAYLTKLAMPLNVAEDSEIGIFNNIYLDIGDNQSIESNLSTFSSHISNISYILKNVTNKDLILFDELCNGTDPKEGEALSIAISKYLIEKKVISIISSHYTLLKKFGLDNKNVLNASFIFDEKKIKPTFKLILGVSGKSYGFLIANKFGIAQDIINDAKVIFEENYMSDETRRIELLEEKEREIVKKEEKLKEYEIKMSKVQSDIDKEKNKLSIRETKLKEQKINDFDEILDKKYREINHIYDEFVKEKNAKKALEKLSKISIEENTENEVLNVGDSVLIKNIETRGVISDIRKNKVKVIDDSGFTFQTTLDNLKKIKVANPTKKISSIDIDDKILNAKQISSSLNLIGYHTYEGVEALKDYLAEAYNKKLSNVKIIHGFGSGKLREALHQELRKNSFVESFSLGNETNGGNGATIVKLKND